MVSVWPLITQKNKKVSQTTAPNKLKRFMFFWCDS